MTRSTIVLGEGMVSVASALHLQRRGWFSCADRPGRTNDVHYHLTGLPHHIGPLLQYWWHSAPKRYAVIVLSTESCFPYRREN